MISWLRNIWQALFPPAPPEWGFVQELYVSKYEVDEFDCSNMAVALACWYVYQGYEARVVLAVRKKRVNHAWTEVEHNGRRWAVDPSADKWTSRPQKWRNQRQYTQTDNVDRNWWLRDPAGEWNTQWFKRNDEGGIVPTEKCPELNHG